MSKTKDPAEAEEIATLCIPSDLSIKPLAMSVLALIAGSQWGLQAPRFNTDVATYAWYNGRERGIALVVKQRNKKRLVFTFGEQRNSDSIFLDKWEDDDSWVQPPTLENFTDETYKKRRYFEYGECGKTALAIVNDIRSYLGLKD